MNMSDGCDIVAGIVYCSYDRSGECPDWTVSCQPSDGLPCTGCQLLDSIPRKMIVSDEDSSDVSGIVAFTVCIWVKHQEAANAR